MQLIRLRVVQHRRREDFKIAGIAQSGDIIRAMGFNAAGAAA